jgi:hypothetical protein
MTQQCQPGASVMGQSAAGEGATVNAAKNGPTVMAVAGGRKQRSRRQPSSRPIQGQQGNPLSRREDGAPVFRSSNGSRARNGCPVNHSSRRINFAAGQAAPLAGEAGDASPLAGYPERDPSPRRKRAPSPPTDQRFEGWPLRGVQQPPQSTQAPCPLLIRGSKAGPSKGFNSRLRVLGIRAHYWSEVRRPAPRKGSTAASGHSGSTPTTDQGFVGWPSKGSQPPQTQSEG